jgi:hypothetical protein
VAHRADRRRQREGTSDQHGTVNTNRGVRRAPLQHHDQVFWGSDAGNFAAAFLTDPSIFDKEEMRRAESLPTGAPRHGSLEFVGSAPPHDPMLTIVSVGFREGQLKDKPPSRSYSGSFIL